MLPLQRRFAALGLALTAAMVPCAPGAAIEPPPNAVTCRACHGADGVSASPDIPNLAGQKSAYLAAQLRAFRDGTRKNDLMSVIAPQLAAADIQALADYWASLPAAGAARDATAQPATVSRMVLPATFPDGFSEYQRANDADANTIGVNYANAIALAAARAGQPLPSGSVLLAVTYAAVLDAAGKPVVDADGRWRLGKRMAYAGMESRAGWGDSIPALLRNGDWHYGLWNAEGAPSMGAAQPRCLACHKPRAADSYVFTIDALRAAAAR